VTAAVATPGTSLLIPVQAVLGIALLFGGAGGGEPLLGAAVELTALALLAYVLILATRGERGPIWTYLAAALVVALPVIQLIPLPPQVWPALPGRALSFEILSMTGQANAWRPLSLEPEKTVGAALELLPGMALFLAAVALPRSRQLRRLAAIVVGVALLSWLLALLQKNSGGAVANLFGSEHIRFGPGLFVNRNHQATFLLIAMPLAAAALRSQARTLYFVKAAAVALILLFAMGVVITRSRAGLALLPIALVSALLILQPIRWTPARAGAAMVGLVAIAGLATQIPAVQTTLARFSDQTERGAFWRDTMAAIPHYWPVGTGMGTFPDVYKSAESIDVVGTHDVNNAHDDYLELMLEGGAPAVGLLIAFFAWFAASIHRLWRLARRGQDVAFGSACAVGIGLILLHSIVDYPLRMMSIMAVFGLLCGGLAKTVQRRDVVNGAGPAEHAPSQVSP
jgi:hypothetical protein